MENAICENYEKKKNQKEHKPQIGHIIQSVGGDDVVLSSNL